MRIVSADTNNLVKKHNDLVRARINIHSKIAGRILATLIAQIRKSDTTLNDTYKISVVDIMQLVQTAQEAYGDISGRKAWGGSEYSSIEKACSELGDATYEIKVKGEEGKKYRKRPFFKDICYEEHSGYVMAKFNSELADFLLKLRGEFTKYLLVDYLLLDSIYSQRLFEILCSWKNNGEVTIPLKELRRMLNVPPSLEKKYKDFRWSVLEPVAEEINSKTSIYYTWEPVKKGTSEQSPVQAIHFVFYEDATHQIRIEGPEEKAEFTVIKIAESEFQQDSPSTMPFGNVVDITQKGLVSYRDNDPETENSLGCVSGLWGSLEI